VQKLTRRQLSPPRKINTKDYRQKDTRTKTDEDMRSHDI